VSKEKAAGTKPRRLDKGRKKGRKARKRPLLGTDPAAKGLFSLDIPVARCELLSVLILSG
jgi:hypothetical protein